MKSARLVCIGRYTFRMTVVVWLLVLAAIGAIAYAFWKWRSRWLEHRRAAEERFASLLAQAKPPAPAVEPPKMDSGLPQQKLLLEAAGKAAEADEPALSIQLYARLLARYPDTAFGAQVRAAVEAQKKKLVKR
jgi:HAMP domain-containing protein